MSVESFPIPIGCLGLVVVALVCLGALSAAIGALAAILGLAEVMLR